MTVGLLVLPAAQVDTKEDGRAELADPKFITTWVACAFDDHGGVVAAQTTYFREGWFDTWMRFATDGSLAASVPLPSPGWRVSSIAPFGKRWLVTRDNNSASVVESDAVVHEYPRFVAHAVRALDGSLLGGLQYGAPREHGCGALVRTRGAPALDAAPPSLELIVGFVRYKADPRAPNELPFPCLTETEWLGNEDEVARITDQSIYDSLSNWLVPLPSGRILTSYRAMLRSGLVYAWYLVLNADGHVRAVLRDVERDAHVCFDPHGERLVEKGAGLVVRDLEGRVVSKVDLGQADAKAFAPFVLHAVDAEGRLLLVHPTHHAFMISAADGGALHAALGEYKKAISAAKKRFGSPKKFFWVG